VVQLIQLREADTSFSSYSVCIQQSPRDYQGEEDVERIIILKLLKKEGGNS
jgi:hypothetical protein